MGGKVWMTNGSLIIGVHHDEIQMFSNLGYQRGRIFDPSMKDVLRPSQPDICWFYHAGTELIDPVYYAYYKGVVIDKIQIKDSSSHDGIFNICHEIMVDGFRTVKYTLFDTLDDAREEAERLIYHRYRFED